LKAGGGPLAGTRRGGVLEGALLIKSVRLKKKITASSGVNSKERKETAIISKKRESYL